jgi:hypothetical protein
VVEFLIADVEVSTIHLRLVVEEPVRRSDNAGPGLDFQRDEPRCGRPAVTTVKRFLCD